MVAGVGTGGTISGVGQGLKAYKPALYVVAVEPAGSAVITQHLAGEPLQPGKHAIQGLGAGFLPKVLDLAVIDEVVAVRDEDALQTTRRLACEEGLMCGISSGAAAWAAIHLAKQAMNAGRQIVVILPDLGERTFLPTYSTASNWVTARDASGVRFCRAIIAWGSAEAAERRSTPSSRSR